MPDSQKADSRNNRERKIIHVDMDCFYAAVEQKENPKLRGKPVAVGGAGRRGVLCTASYEARKFGCRSAMPGFKALELCPELIIVPVRFDLYKSASAQIRAIFGRFTEVIEPLSLDEAYLDVSHWNTSGAAVAREIRNQIWEETGLTASAGISVNKQLAKIASDWEKPNGQHEIKSTEIEQFMQNLEVGKLWGVGKKMQQKLERLGVRTCGDLQAFSKVEMAQKLGNWGLDLYRLCRGIDEREVTTHRVRKSVSKETTFGEDVIRVQELFPSMLELLKSVSEVLDRRYKDRRMKSLVVKLKFNDFTQTTVERASSEMTPELCRTLLLEGWLRGGEKAVRLLGVGAKLANDDDDGGQMEMKM